MLFLGALCTIQTRITKKHSIRSMLRQRQHPASNDAWTDSAVVLGERLKRLECGYEAAPRLVSTIRDHGFGARELAQGL